MFSEAGLGFGTGKNGLGKTMDFLTDEEIDSMFDDAGAPVPEPPALAGLPEVPLYPLALAQSPTPAAPNGQPPEAAGLFTKKVGPLPTWAWLLIGGGVVGTGYFYLRGKKTSEGSSESPSIGDVVSNVFSGGGDGGGGSSGGWEPSRSAFASKLDGYLTKKGLNGQATVWRDAEDAQQKGKMSSVSPLINVQVHKNSAVKVDQGLQRFCRREGLNPIAHADGNIGLYPHTGKRGREWEQYIDALRDEGQKV